MKNKITALFCALALSATAPAMFDHSAHARGGNFTRVEAFCFSNKADSEISPKLTLSQSITTNNGWSYGMLNVKLPRTTYPLSRIDSEASNDVFHTINVPVRSDNNTDYVQEFNIYTSIESPNVSIIEFRFNFENLPGTPTEVVTCAIPAAPNQAPRP